MSPSTTTAYLTVSASSASQSPHGSFHQRTTSGRRRSSIQPLVVLRRDRHQLHARPAQGQIVAGAPNGWSTSGTSTVPSSRWWFSAIAMIVRPTATAVPLSVCTWRGDVASSGRWRTSSRRAWKAVVFEQEVSSR